MRARVKYKNWCEKQGTDEGMTQNHRCKDDGSSYTDPTFYVAAFEEGNLHCLCRTAGQRRKQYF